MDGRHQADPLRSPVIRPGQRSGVSKTLLSAVELGVFSELALGPCGGEELAARLGLHPRGARRA